MPLQSPCPCHVLVPLTCSSPSPSPSHSTPLLLSAPSHFHPFISFFLSFFTYFIFSIFCRPFTRSILFIYLFSYPSPLFALSFPSPTLHYTHDIPSSSLLVRRLYRLTFTDQPDHQTRHIATSIYYSVGIGHHRTRALTIRFLCINRIDPHALSSRFQKKAFDMTR